MTIIRLLIGEFIWIPSFERCFKIHSVCIVITAIHCMKKERTKKNHEKTEAHLNYSSFQVFHRNVPKLLWFRWNSRTKYIHRHTQSLHLRRFQAFQCTFSSNILDIMAALFSRTLTLPFDYGFCVLFLFATVVLLLMLLLFMFVSICTIYTIIRLHSAFSYSDTENPKGRGKSVILKQSKCCGISLCARFSFFS